MKLALHYEMARPVLDDHLLLEETMEQIIFADEVGFDYVWLVEHHFLTGFSGCPANDIIYGALSQRTKQIRLGLGVIVLPMHHPVQVAERVAVLDHLAEGRVDFGTGRSAIYELEGMGLDARDSRSMWDESLTMVPKIWGPTGFPGKASTGAFRLGKYCQSHTRTLTRQSGWLPCSRPPTVLPPRKE